MPEKSKRRWTEEDLQLLHELYPTGAIDEIVQRLCRSRQAVKHAAITRGLTGQFFNGRGCPSPVGTEILRRGLNSYVMVKVIDEAGAQTWVRKHHRVWQAAHGSLPAKGTRLQFKDGDRSNCDIGNLELIDDVEAARRMNQLRSYPPVLQDTIRALSELKKAINDRENNGRPPQPRIRRTLGSEDRREP